MSAKKLAAQVKLLLMDVDGVLTDGKLYNVPGPDGKMVETKGFDSQDGISLQWLARLGIPAGLISGRVSPATVERANDCSDDRGDGVIVPGIIYGPHDRLFGVVSVSGDALWYSIRSVPLRTPVGSSSRAEIR